MTEPILDRRVRRTRNMLRRGLLELMEQKPMQQITVKELCHICDINRGTFYLHYKDVHQLLSSIEEELLTHLEEMLDTLTPAILTNPAPSPELCSVFEFLGQNSDIVKVLLCGNGDPAFLAQVQQVIRRRVLPSWGDQFVQGSATSDYVYEFVVAGCIGMLEHWLRQDMPLPPATMAAMVETMLSKGILQQ